MKLLTGNARYMNFRADVEGSNALYADSLNQAALSLRQSQRVLNVDEHQLNAIRGNLMEITGNHLLSQIALNGALIATEQFKRLNLAAQTNVNEKMVEKLAKEISLYGEQILNAKKSGKKIDAETINQNIKNLMLRTFGTEQMNGQINGTVSAITGALSKLGGVDIFWL